VSPLLNRVVRPWRVDVILSPFFLWRAAEGHPVGDVWPYRGGSEADIHEHLRHAAEVLGQGPLVDTEPDFAMLLDEAIRSALVYCTKRPLRTTVRDGVVVFLSAVAPLAAYCPMSVDRSQRGVARTLHLPRAGDVPSGGWEAEEQWLVTQLEGLGFAVPSRQELVAVLPDSSEIPKALRGQSQFNAIFC
jgi:hypothetical protein